MAVRMAVTELTVTLLHRGKPFASAGTRNMTVGKILGTKRGWDGKRRRKGGGRGGSKALLIAGDCENLIIRDLSTYSTFSKIINRLF
jgi:hypothetical protein